MKQKILLAMSGGVDSSAAIVVLKQKYEVVGVTFQFFSMDSVQAINDAVSIAEKFGIEHHIVDHCEEFRENVIKPFAEAWLDGVTPNPCAICNRNMKFPALFRKADELGCDLVSTGHYARSENGVLKIAVTENGEINPKDQSYMLYALTPEQLSKIVFPLGNLSKASVRRIASENGLTNADKPDSQDICFIPDGDYASFIEKFSGFNIQSGDFITANGEIIGKHKGHIHYTIGQRRGLGISSHNRLFVIGKNASDNTVTVGGKGELSAKEFTVGDVVWHVPTLPTASTVKTRYSLNGYSCIIEHRSETIVNCQLSEQTRLLVSTCPLPSPGQIAVFYNEAQVIGGGTIL